MNDCKAYIEKIYKSIRKNVSNFDAEEDVAAMQTLIDKFQEFYLSLFAAGKGNNLILIFSIFLFQLLKFDMSFYLRFYSAIFQVFSEENRWITN